MDDVAGIERCRQSAGRYQSVLVVGYPGLEPRTWPTITQSLANNSSASKGNSLEMWTGLGWLISHYRDGKLRMKGNDRQTVATAVSVGAVLL